MCVMHPEKIPAAPWHDPDVGNGNGQNGGGWPPPPEGLGCGVGGQVPCPKHPPITGTKMVSLQPDCLAIQMNYFAGTSRPLCSAEGLSIRLRQLNRLVKSVRLDSL